VFGKVKSFKTKNGSGFIHKSSQDTSGYIQTLDADVFVHVSNILENEGDPSDILIPGELVEYDLHDFRRGPSALRVRRLNPLTLPTQIGLITKKFDNLGYGFVGSTKGDVFFHFADVMYDDFTIGDEVSYLLAVIENKQRALRVRRK